MYINLNLNILSVVQCFKVSTVLTAMIRSYFLRDIFVHDILIFIIHH